ARQGRPLRRDGARRPRPALGERDRRGDQPAPPHQTPRLLRDHQEGADPLGQAPVELRPGPRRKAAQDHRRPLGCTPRGACRGSLRRRLPRRTRYLMGLIESLLHYLFRPAPEALGGVRGGSGRTLLARGRVVARDSLTSPLTERRCVYYRYLVE